MWAETTEQNGDNRTGVSPDPGSPQCLTQSDQWNRNCGLGTARHFRRGFLGLNQIYESESQGEPEVSIVNKISVTLGETLLRTMSKLLVHRDRISLLLFGAFLKDLSEKTENIKRSKTSLTPSKYT